MNNGDIYEGEFKNNKVDGYGVLNKKIGGFYKG